MMVKFKCSGRDAFSTPRVTTRRVKCIHRYAFFVDPVEASELNKVGPCGMGAGSKCQTIIGLWAVGFTGYCINGPMGFRFGGNNVYKQAAMEVIKLS